MSLVKLILEIDVMMRITIIFIYNRLKINLPSVHKDLSPQKKRAIDGFC